MLNSFTCLRAEEIMPYKLTGVEGKVAMRYFSDEQTTSGDSPREDGSDIKELIVDVQTHNYVYHPNFLKLDIGGGIVVLNNKQKSSRTSEQQEVNETTYNFNTRLNFLEKKPYPFSLYFERRNPVVLSGIGEHFLQKNTKYGATMAYRERSFPVSINVETFKLTAKGEGNSVVVDDEVSNVTMRLFQNNKSSGHRQFVIQSDQNSSNSGNTGDTAGPITGSNVNAFSVNYDSNTLIGNEGQFTFRDALNYTDRASSTRTASDSTYSQWRYTPNLRWRHSKTLNSFYNMDYLSSVQKVNSETETRNTSIGMGYTKTVKDRGSHSMTIDTFDKFTTGFTAKSYGLSGSADYSMSFGTRAKRPNEKTKDLSIGKVKFQVGLGYHEVDKAGELGKKFDEPHTFSTTKNSVELIHENVDENSIIVRNSTTRVPYPKSDYYTDTIGNKTTVYRAVVSTIPDGEVLIDYDYNPGGTYSSTITDSSLRATVDMYKRFTMFVGVARKDIDITSGFPGIDIKSTDTRSVGVTYDSPVFDWLGVGADVRVKRELKSLAPHDRNSVSAYMQARVMRSTFLRISGQTLTVEYRDAAQQNVDLQRFNVRLSTRPSRRSTISLSAVSEKDDGGTTPRELLNLVFKWQWSYRRLFFTLDATRNLEKTQASNNNNKVSHERNFFRATLERRF